jgi:hypothetical protein
MSLKPSKPTISIFIVFTIALFIFLVSSQRSTSHKRLASKINKKNFFRNSIDVTKVKKTFEKKKDNRRVALWIIKEEKDQVAALFHVNHNKMYQVFERQLNYMETAYHKCEAMLLEFGLNIEQVEFLKAIKKGPSQYSDDLTTYVSLVTNKNAKKLQKTLSENNRNNGTMYKYIFFNDLNFELAIKKPKYKYNIKQDFPDVRDFLVSLLCTSVGIPFKISSLT